MKTKIIYISGAEIFDMADIRGAFDQVRAALGLNNDTVLFGVPVDAENALGGEKETQSQHHTIAISDIPQTFENNETVAPVAEIIQETPAIIETEIPTETLQTAQEEIIIAAEKPKKTTRKPRTRTKAADIIAVAEDSNAADVTPTDDAVVENAAPVAEETDVAAPVIPILSVLASKATAVASDAPLEIADEDITAEEIIEKVDIIDETADITADDEKDVAPIVQDINIDTELVAPALDADEDTAPQRVTIGDMINDEAPRKNVEKTLEQLLESMTPLREDHIIEEEAAPEMSSTPEPIELSDTGDSDADATLERLAAEFAESQDKIIVAPRAENHGKIGKLKNILPFKKVKRDDTGLMGDLFGFMVPV